MTWKGANVTAKIKLDILRDHSDIALRFNTTSHEQECFGWYWLVGQGQESQGSSGNNGNLGATLNDYQVKVVVPYDSDMKPDFSDVRFVDNNDANQLSYWRES